MERVQKPENWDKWSVLRKSAWYQAHKDEILADMDKYGLDRAAWRWGMGKATLHYKFCILWNKRLGRRGRWPAERTRRCRACGSAFHLSRIAGGTRWSRRRLCPECRRVAQRRYLPHPVNEEQWAYINAHPEKSLRELGRELGISHEWVRRIKNRAGTVRWPSDASGTAGNADGIE